MTATVTTPRGNNIGDNIINYLKQRNIYGRVRITTIETVRDTTAKACVTTINYELKP